jgi:monomeric isocitrate dehydrogenase
MYFGRGWNPRTSILSGRSTAQLQADLASAQQAYIELSSGGRVVTASYTQGDGSKSVTYTQASMPNLMALIKELQAQLGIICYARRPIRPTYR